MAQHSQRRRSSEEADGRGTWIEDDGLTSVEPESGTLVVFRSEAVPHEVLETRRARQAVVGWIHGSIDSYYNGAFDDAELGEEEEEEQEEQEEQEEEQEEQEENGGEAEAEAEAQSELQAR